MDPIILTDPNLLLTSLLFLYVLGVFVTMYKSVELETERIICLRPDLGEDFYDVEVAYGANYEIKTELSDGTLVPQIPEIAMPYD